MKTLLLWLRIIRPQTLFASACPVLAALILTGIQDTLVAAITLTCSLALQVLSNLINDYYDFLRGTDKKARAGFRRALAEGEVSEGQMKAACLTALSVAILLGLYLIYIGGWPILVIGLTAILFAWLYTATSHSLSYLGIADLFVLLYFGIVPAIGTAILQGATPDLHVVCAGATSGLISMCVLMTNNLRDREDDKQAGKRTLPVRFGKTAGDFLVLIYAILIPILAREAFGSAFPYFALLYPALLLFFFIQHAKGKQYNFCLLGAGLLNALYVLLAFMTHN